MTGTASVTTPGKAQAGGVQSAQEVGGSYHPDALEANRAGRLTDGQRRAFAAYDRSWRRGEVGLALVFVVLAALVLTATGPAPNASLRPVAGAAFLVLALAVAIHAMPARDPLARDLRTGRIESLESAMEKHTFSAASGSSASTSHYLDIGDRHFEVGSAEYEAAPQAAIVRVYFLPQSHRVVNLERLPDRPVDAAAMESPMAAVQALTDAMRTTGAAHHEAMAAMVGFGDAMRPQRVAAAVPPPAEERDPRPLAQAIVGTWRSGFMSVTFEPDGSLRVGMPGGRQQTGRWSVDSSGRLHADAMGGGQSGDAWIVGDTLTVSAEGEGLTLHRVVEA